MDHYVFLSRDFMMYFLIPVWLCAGFADWVCHRLTYIERTSGLKESLIHLIMLSEIGLSVLAGLFLEINALVFLLMLAAFLLHEVTALWDVSFATKTRVITPIEQHIHSFLELMPLMALSLLALLYWEQFISIWGMGNTTADWHFRLKQPPISNTYLAGLFVAIMFLQVGPYLEELWRTWRYRKVAAAENL